MFSHTQLGARDLPAMIRFYTALAMGAQDEGAPGLRPQYGQDYYGAYCRDIEGNKLCFVHACGLADPDVP